MFITNKTVLVTGSTDGIGKQTAIVLAGQGARVLVHGRDSQKVERTLAEIRQLYPDAQLAGYTADFSSLNAVEKMAEEIKHSETFLHVLVNNAGTYSSNFQLSHDGYELTFAVNQLAPFLLTLSLLDTIKASSPARIINVTSIGHNIRELDFESIHEQDAYRAWNAYKISKFANILFTYTLVERLKKSKVTVNCLHPGTVNTKVLQSSFPDMEGCSIDEGARTSIYLASSDDIDTVTGKYFIGLKATASAPNTYDKKIQQEMWEHCERWVGKRKNEKDPR